MPHPLISITGSRTRPNSSFGLSSSPTCLYHGMGSFISLRFVLCVCGFVYVYLFSSMYVCMHLYYVHLCVYVSVCVSMCVFMSVCTLEAYKQFLTLKYIFNPYHVIINTLPFHINKGHHRRWRPVQLPGNISRGQQTHHRQLPAPDTHLDAYTTVCAGPGWVLAPL